MECLVGADGGAVWVASTFVTTTLAVVEGVG